MPANNMTIPLTDQSIDSTLILHVESTGKEHSRMTTTTKRFRAVMPDLSDREATKAYLEELEKHQYVRGVPTLILFINKYKTTEGVLKNQLNQIKRTIDYINGLRYGNMLKVQDDNLEHTSRAYFSKLSDDVLQWQAELFLGEDFKLSKVPRDKVIDLLVEKQAQLASGGRG